MPPTSRTTPARCSDGASHRSATVLPLDGDGVPEARDTGGMSDLHVLAPGFAPTPFTADEIQQWRTTWLQLQGHASFPVSAVTVTPDTVELP